MSEKESPSMKALRIVYGDEVIVVQCVTASGRKGQGAHQGASGLPGYCLCTSRNTGARAVVCAEKKRALDIPATA